MQDRHPYGDRRRAHHASHPPKPPTPTPSGLTLLETLVVLVLVALLGTTMLQGIGFFSGQYAVAQRSNGQAFASSLRQRWFVDSVQGLHPYGMAAQRFVGDGASFAGVTLHPLFAEPGMLVRARWSIAPRGTATGAAWQVAYQEEDGAEWPIFADAEGELAFQYADAAGQWHERWPAATAPLEWTPTLIRLTSATRGDLWLARVEAAPLPLHTEATLR